MAEEAEYGDDGWKGARRRDVQGAENEATASGYETTAKDKAAMAAKEEDADIAIALPLKS